MKLINTCNINEARKQIQEQKIQGKEIIVEAQNDEFNRKIFENKDVDMVIGLEFNKKDKLKQKDSGLNEVLTKLAKENNIKIGINIGEIKKLNRKEKAIILARIMQNIMLCKKAGAEIKALNYEDKDKREVFSLLLTLRASTSQAKKAVE